MKELFQANTWDMVLLKGDLNAALFDYTSNTKEFTMLPGSNVITNTNSPGIKRGIQIRPVQNGYQISFTKRKGTITVFKKSDMVGLVLLIYDMVAEILEKYPENIGLS